MSSVAEHQSSRVRNKSTNIAPLHPDHRKIRPRHPMDASAGSVTLIGVSFGRRLIETLVSQFVRIPASSGIPVHLVATSAGSWWTVREGATSGRCGHHRRIEPIRRDEG